MVPHARDSKYLYSLEPMTGEKAGLSPHQIIFAGIRSI